MKPFPIVVVLFILIVVSAFFSQPSESPRNDLKTLNATLGQNILLKINQSAHIPSENITLTFLNVTEDSRCPKGVSCVWAGQVTILLKFRDNDGDKDVYKFNMTLSISDKKLAIQNKGNYTFTLLKVEPYPEADNPISAEEYVAMVRIDKKN